MPGNVDAAKVDMRRWLREEERRGLDLEPMPGRTAAAFAHTFRALENHRPDKAVDTSPTSACAQVWCRHATSRVDANPGSRNTGGRFDDAPSTASRSASRMRSVERSRPQCLSATTTSFSSLSWTDGRHVLGSLRENHDEVDISRTFLRVRNIVFVLFGLID